MQTEERPHALPQRLLGRSGLRVSALGLGGAGLGGAYGEITDDQAVEAVQAALGGGVTYIDTSPLYRESERRIGLALKGIDRARIVLSTKTAPRLSVSNPTDLSHGLGAEPAVQASVQVRISPSLSTTWPSPASRTRVLSLNSTPRASIRSRA